MTTQVLGSIALLYFFGVSLGVVVLYAMVPWYASALGRIMMVKAAAILGLAVFAVIFTIVWPDSRPVPSVDADREHWRLAGRVVLYTLISGGQTGALVYMWRLRYRSKGIPNRMSRKRDRGVG